MTMVDYFGPHMQGYCIKTFSATKGAQHLLCVDELINPLQAHALIPLFNKGNN